MDCTTDGPRTGKGRTRGDSLSNECPAPRRLTSGSRVEPPTGLPSQARDDQLPEGPITLAETLTRLAAILPRLAAALERQSEDRQRVERLTYRIEDLADALGVSRRFFERARAAGRLPKPDLRIGKVPLWRVETIRNWLDKGGRP